MDAVNHKVFWKAWKIMPMCQPTPSNIELIPWFQIYIEQIMMYSIDIFFSSFTCEVTKSLRHKAFL